MIIVDESEPIGEIEPPFESRDVLIRRGLNVRDFYIMEKEIGRGKFGTVYKCREKSTGLRLAAKFVQAPKKADRLNVEREVEIMKSLRNSRLIQLYDAYDDGKKEICLLLELIEGGELFERVIDDDFVLTERACAIFMRQICEGIQFIHLQHVLHLDMKPENILCLTRTGNRIKLIDFGLARRFDPSKKLQVLFGTPEFVAPEVVNFETIGYGTDLWSVGIICYVLLSGLSPFMGETDVETMANVTIAKYDFEDEAFNDVSPEAKDFISKLLIKQISKRMTATECLRHPWLRPRPPLPTASESSAGASERPTSSQTSSDEEDDELMDSSSSSQQSSSAASSPSPPVLQQHVESQLPPPPPFEEIVPIIHQVALEEAAIIQQSITAINESAVAIAQIINEPIIRSIPIEIEPKVDPPPVVAPLDAVVNHREIIQPTTTPEAVKPPTNLNISLIPSPSAKALTGPPSPSSTERSSVSPQPPHRSNPVQDRFKGNSNSRMNNKTPTSCHPQPTARKSSNIEAIQNKFSNKFNNNKSAAGSSSAVNYSRSSSKTSTTKSSTDGAAAATAASVEVLQLTKVNLRQFVERWSSQSSSPFQLLSESKRGTISLLISSPTVTNAPWSAASSALAAAAEAPKQQQVNATDTTGGENVETAIEQTTALLKSVKESLIKQMESGTAVRDRTGARVWDRGGLMMDSPVSQQHSSRRTMQMAASLVNGTVVPPPPPLNDNNNNKEEEEQQLVDDWEVHAPVAAKTFGFAKRQQTTVAKTVLVAKTLEESSSYSLLTATSVIQQQQSSSSLNQA